jgi:histidinol-phosphate aminotransferase
MEPRDLSGHTPYSAGRGIEEVARELDCDPADLIKLSSNENPLGPSPAAVDAIRESAATVNTYPKAVHTDLTAAIADHWDLAPNQVWLTPGGDGFLDYIARALLDAGDRVLVPDPGFAYYAMSARYRDAVVDAYALDREQDFAQTAQGVLDAYDGHRVVYVTSPHSPTGSEMPRGEIEALAEGVDPETLVLVDEAYGEFTDSESARALLADHANVAVLRTFSKAYGLAGLRVGYGLVSPELADTPDGATYDLVNTPFAVNKLACRAALAALGDDDHVTESVEVARWSRAYMHEHLDARTWESGGNFVLAAVGDGARVAEAAKREGVIVRDCASFGLPGCLRITCGTRETTPEAVAVINEVVDG